MQKPLLNTRNAVLYISFFVMLFSIITGVFGKNSISQNLFDIFPHEDVRLITAYQSFKASNQIIFTIDPSIPEEAVNIFKREVMNIGGAVQLISSINDVKDDDAFTMINRYRFLRTAPDTTNIDDEFIKNKMIYNMEQVILNPFGGDLTELAQDPLDLFGFSAHSGNNFQFDIDANGNFFAKSGEKLIFLETTVPSADIETSRLFLKSIEQIIKQSEFHNRINYFSLHLFTVQNSAKIKFIVTILSVISIFFILILFQKAAKNRKLLFCSFIIMIFSINAAFWFSVLVFKEISVLTLAFCSGILGIGIDYTTHYYCSNYLSHKPFKVHRNVFIGCITSITGFLVLVFSGIPLWQQIGFFCAMSLLFLSASTTWIMPLMFGDEFIANKPASPRKSTSLLFIGMCLFCIIMLPIIASQIQMDGNLRNLDYRNTVLMEKEEFIKQNVTGNLSGVLISGKSIEELLENCEKTSAMFLSQGVGGKYICDFVPSLKLQKKAIEKNKLSDWGKIRETVKKDADKIGFNSAAYADTYNFSKLQSIPFTGSSRIAGMEIVQEGGVYYTLAFIEKPAESLPFAAVIDQETLFADLNHTIYKQFLIMFVLMFIAVAIVLSAALKSVRKVLTALSFIVCPIFIAAVFMYFSGSGLNLMHLLSFFVLMIAGIDIGVYFTESTGEHAVDKAVFISTTTTLIGFAPLLFSKIGALISAGLPISIGFATIMIMWNLNKISPTGLINAIRKNKAQY